MKISRWLWLIPLSVNLSLAHAAITVSSVTGASNSTITASTNTGTGTTTGTPTTGTSQLLIYGGIGGGGLNSTDRNCGPTAGTSTCNGCAQATTWGICNTRMIYGTTQLAITFASSTSAGKAILVNDAGTVVTAVSAATLAINSYGSIIVTWSEICTKMGLNSINCSASDNSTRTSKTFKLGVDANLNNQLDSGEDTLTFTITVVDPDPTGTGDLDQIHDCPTNADAKPGVCGFLAYPGDAKVYIDDLGIGAGFPSLGTGTAQKVQFWYSTLDFNTQTSPAGLTPAELSFDSSSATEIVFPDNIISGLNNSDVYYFRASVLDEANNSFYFTSDMAISNICGTLSPTLPYNTACTFYAAPSKVLGFLEEDLNCFVATAASGSQTSLLVSFLRDFRNKALLPYIWGQAFVKHYYQFGPKLALWLHQHPQFKPVTRILLWPLALLGKVIATTGWMLFAVVMCTGAVGLVLQRKWRRAKI